jgi:ABC-2 type transport system permease protein
MLALEGQIYESDPGNPELSATGALDYAFVVATLLPLLLILTLHDLWASERRAGRLELLCATHTGGERVLVQRAVARAALVTAAIVIPLLVAALTARAPLAGTFGVAGVAVVHAAFWTVMSVIVARRVTAGPTTLTVLLGAWLVLSIVIPVAGKLVAERSVAVPSGGELLLLQREAVNDAWDKPKAATMTPFVAAHPQWAPHAAIEKPFEWKWYYAFQQVGDQVAEPLSQAYREGRKKRDKVAGLASLISPASLLQRTLEGMSKTDMKSAMAYESDVRDYHAQLRAWYYPRMFKSEDYDAEMANRSLPDFCSSTRMGE